MNARAQSAALRELLDTPVDEPVQEPARPRRQGRRRTVVVAVGVLTLIGLTAAVTLPIALDAENSSSVDAMREQLAEVSRAQTGWQSRHGTYTTSLSDLGFTEQTGDVAIVRADTTSFCVGAYDSSTRSTLFYSSAKGWSTSACT